MNRTTAAAFNERRFELPWLTMAAAEWGTSDGLPVLAAHGWLDNAGSFDLLAPLVTGSHIVALDLAGHGFSGFRSPDASYNIWQDVGDLIDVADQLSWERFNLLGHSRGAAISMLLAATFPERVDRLVLLEGGVPIIGDAEEAPSTLARALLDRRSLSRKSGRVFTDRDTAITERAGGFSKVSRDAAQVLARRSLREVPGGFQWHADQRLKGSSELKLTADHVRAFIARVSAPVLMILAEQSPFGDWVIYQEMISRFAMIEVVRLPGGHHFHLEGAQDEIARRVRRFYGLET
ncbi:MAG TPA: alpha/beta hydrolase [Gammaproteobacteria bacterium]|nr:alpha/beta hydrolase [Gammaproteobacteria bacterium]